MSAGGAAGTAGRAAGGDADCVLVRVSGVLAAVLVLALRRASSCLRVRSSSFAFSFAFSAARLFVRAAKAS